MTHSFTCIRLCKPKIKGKRQTDMMPSPLDRLLRHAFVHNMKPAETASVPLRLSNGWHTHTHTYMTLLIFKKSQLGVWPGWEKKKGEKWDGLMRKRGVAFLKTKEFVGTKSRICMWDKADWQEDMMSHTHTIFCSMAVAPQSHNLPPEQTTHMPIYGHSQDRADIIHCRQTRVGAANK